MHAYVCMPMCVSVSENLEQVQLEDSFGNFKVTSFSVGGIYARSPQSLGHGLIPVCDLLGIGSHRKR